LDRLKDNYDDDEGAYIATAFFKKFPLITSTNLKKEIINATSDPVNWRVTRKEFGGGKNSNVLKFLKDENYRPTSKW